MEVKIKKVEHFVLNLNHEEVTALQSILNYHETVTKVPQAVHVIAQDIWKELDSMGVDSVSKD